MCKIVAGFTRGVSKRLNGSLVRSRVMKSGMSEDKLLAGCWPIDGASGRDRPHPISSSPAVWTNQSDFYLPASWKANKERLCCGIKVL